jgi:hypothetical protein
MFLVLINVLKASVTTLGQELLGHHFQTGKMIIITKEMKSGVQMLAQLQTLKSSHLNNLGQQVSLA